MYGLNPRSISSRIAKLTYGINTLTTFDPEKSRHDKKVIIDNEDFCEVIYFILILFSFDNFFIINYKLKDVFDPFVKKGESISSDEVHTKIYCPVRNK